MTPTRVCSLDELPPGSLHLISDGAVDVGVYNLDGALYGLEDRCSHDDGPLCEGEFDADDGIAVCPRHGARFDIRTGRALSLPATQAVATYPVWIDESGATVLIALDEPSLPV